MHSPVDETPISSHGLESSRLSTQMGRFARQVAYFPTYLTWKSALERSPPTPLLGQ